MFCCCGFVVKRHKLAKRAQKMFARAMPAQNAIQMLTRDAQDDCRAALAEPGFATASRAVPSHFHAANIRADCDLARPFL